MDEIRRRNFKIAENYSAGGVFEKWRVYDDNIYCLTDVSSLLENNIFPELRIKLKSIDKTKILSVSANRSGIENLLQEELGEDYFVIASDISNADRLEGRSKKLRADAFFLPFENNSMDAIMDLNGALWYQLPRDEPRNHLELLLIEYRRVLKPGGLLIIDGSIPDTDYGTFDKLNNDKSLTGFSLPKIISNHENAFVLYEFN